MKTPLGSFRKLQAREKGWILVWIVAAVVVGYGRWVHAPRASEIRDAGDQIEKLDREKINLMVRAPDVPKRQAQMDALKQEIVSIYERITEAEKPLLDTQNVDRLLDRLVKDRERFQMQLNSIRPVEQKDPSSVSRDREGDKADPYKRLNVQVDAFSSFQGLVEYVRFLETLNPYQWVERIKVKVEGKEFSRPHAVLLLTVLTGRPLEFEEVTRKEIFSLMEEVAAREKKDPFLTAERPKETTQATGLTLNGIFSEGGKPVAALINNEIYRVGDMVDQKKIVAIEAGRVLLEKGNRRFVLTAAASASQSQPEAGL